MPINELPEDAQKAWLSYQAMCKSKESYFVLLQELDQKYREGGNVTLTENLQLEKLLSAHNVKVAEFSQAMSAVTNTESRALLLQLMGNGQKWSE